jgi:hypothetical protein
MGTQLVVDTKSGGKTILLGRAIRAGDQTVPSKSADHQFNSSKLKGIFRQNGYEHQESYQSDRAVRSTLYCIVRIAQDMRWNDGD